jgi:hypothetical protein
MLPRFTKTFFYILAIALILSACVVSAFFRTTPQQIQQHTITVTVVVTPTAMPTPTGMSDKLYALQVVTWLGDINDANKVIANAFENKAITKVQLQAAVRTIIRVQSELHSTTPPVAFRRTHTQLTDCIDLYVSALQDYAAGNIPAGNLKLDRATELMRTLPDTMPDSVSQL